ncbi:SH3 domain-containing protein [Acinetobacter johnsonii]|nr:SH3 domain-containing protein [Acinetobacter johnsonii]
MNYIFFPFLMTISTCIYADFGLIQDKDGYVNVRESADLSSKVISKQKNGEIVSCVDDIVNNFCFINSSSGVNGYIYNNRINRFDSYNKIKLKKYDVKTVLYRNSLYTVEISSKDADLNSKIIPKA